MRLTGTQIYLVYTVDAKLMNATGRDPLPDKEINYVSARICYDSRVMTGQDPLPEINGDATGRYPLSRYRGRFYRPGSVT